MSGICVKSIKVNLNNANEKSMKSNLKCNNCSFFRSFGGDVFIQFGLQQSGQIASSMPLPTRASRKPGRFFFSDENRKLFQTQRNDKRWKCLNVSQGTDRRKGVRRYKHDATPSIVKFIYNSSKTFYLPFYFVQRFDVASFFLCISIFSLVTDLAHPTSWYPAIAVEALEHFPFWRC